MEIPIIIRKTFKDPDQFCPIGCDPERTQIALSKPGRKMKGNFVQVYYRKVHNVTTKPPIDFWSDLYERSERASQQHEQQQRKLNSFKFQRAKEKSRTSPASSHR